MKPKLSNEKKSSLAVLLDWRKRFTTLWEKEKG